jgi:hypothetical protein
VCCVCMWCVWCVWCVCSEKGSHDLTWRDVFDVAVRWRQASDPYFAVLYFDALGSHDFTDKCLTKTNVIVGQQRIVRYFSEVRCDGPWRCGVHVTLTLPVRALASSSSSFRGCLS